MIELQRREFVAVLLLSLAPHDAIALASELLETKARGKPPERPRPNPAEKPDRPNSIGEGRAGRDIGGRTETATRMEPRLRERERRATGEKQKEYSGRGKEKKRERDPSDRNTSRQDRATGEGRMSTAARNARTKAAEHTAASKSLSREQAAKARTNTQAVTRTVLAARVARYAVAAGAITSAAGTLATKLEPASKFLGRVTLPLTVGAHGLGVYELRQTAAANGSTMSYPDAIRTELDRSYLEPVRTGVGAVSDFVGPQVERVTRPTGEFIDRQTGALGREVVPPLERGIHDWINQGTGWRPGQW